MNLLGRKKDNPPSEETDGASAAGLSGDGRDTGVRVTAPKGRPTPKRNQTRARGPVAPAPMTSAEARKRKKAAKESLTKEERKAEKVTRRAAMADRREKMMAGDDAYLLPRDKGALRRFTRDIVDSRRNLLGLFMPAALALVFVMLSLPSVQIQYYVQFVMLGLVAVMVIDGFLIARRVNRGVDAKFPDNTESGWKLGFYAASRASQLRRMRAPRPQVERGAKVA
ncbi:DUF3043 domain-containing protein [Mycolicibacterium hodleri]|uniref:DUF3043 domain-containing protein n=1 Tax=Mycolicibacterium hodleri TaxID=49897 RepID=A0A502E5F9_9MYCO|nr:DUF3043 domain-containing protein [Mycolicibacterium hodleri]TPG32584.1 DUF3043 domain-containing protein [Mycolicibacterium hodleri]